MIWVELTCDRCSRTLEGDSLHCIRAPSTTRRVIILEIHRQGEKAGWVRIDGLDYCERCKGPQTGERDDLA